MSDGRKRSLITLSMSRWARPVKCSKKCFRGYKMDIIINGYSYQCEDPIISSAYHSRKFEVVTDRKGLRLLCLSAFRTETVPVNFSREYLPDVYDECFVEIVSNITVRSTSELWAKATIKLFRR
jgi:hypothetical protein